MPWLIALLGSLWLAPAPGGAACSCVGPVTPAEALESADAVFTGRVVSIRDTVLGEDGWRRRAVTLRVGRAWKGVETETVTVVTGQGGGDCGFPFARRQEYLVYASRRGAQAGAVLGTGICGRTALLSRADEDLRVLGNPPPPGQAGGLEPRCAGWSCGCTPHASASAARDLAAAVFAGRVVGVRDTTVVFEGEENAMAAVTLQVERAWKGLAEDRVTVLTGRSDPCGVRFKQGESYLVYAETWIAAGGRLTTSRCERTAPLSAARGDLRELGAPGLTWPASAAEHR